MRRESGRDSAARFDVDPSGGERLVGVDEGGGSGCRPICAGRSLGVGGERIGYYLRQLPAKSRRHRVAGGDEPEPYAGIHELSLGRNHKPPPKILCSSKVIPGRAAGATPAPRDPSYQATVTAPPVPVADTAVTGTVNFAVSGPPDDPVTVTFPAPTFVSASSAARSAAAVSVEIDAVV